MTSIAGFLASLTGGAPQEGQKAAQVNATGTIGLFSALISANDTAQTAEGESGVNPGLLGLSLQIPNAQVTINTASGDGALGDDLTEGLSIPPGAVEAAIVEGQVSADGTIAIDAGVASASPQDGVQETTGTGETAGTTPFPDENVEGGSAAGSTPEPAIPADTPDAQPVAAVTLQSDATVTVQPATTQTAASTQASQSEATDQLARLTGLENARHKASEKGRQNGLQNALNLAPRPRAAGEAPQTNKPDGSPDASRPGSTDISAEHSTIKPGQGRPEFAALETKPVQRVIDAVNGQTQIRIDSYAGGEATAATNPPTLTVNVPASAASPGPASPNTPHVPVSALAVHIAQQANNGARRFDIRLDPPELGRIEVRLDVSREGQVMTHLVVERAETLDLLQRDARQLERMLQDAGLNTSEDGMKFSLKDQGQAKSGDENPGTFDDDGTLTGAEEDAAESGSDSTMPPPGRYLASTGIDIRI